MGLRQTLLKPIAAVAGANARRQGRALTRACHNAPAAQDALLQRLLSAFGQSDYSRDHKLASVKTYADFCKAVPVAGYDYIKPYIDRMRNGDFSEGLAAVREKTTFGYIDTSGRTVIKPQFDLAGAFGGGLAPVKIGEKWGYVDTTGALTIEPQFDDAGAFIDPTQGENAGAAARTPSRFTPRAKLIGTGVLLVGGIVVLVLVL